MSMCVCELCVTAYVWLSNRSNCLFCPHFCNRNSRDFFGGFSATVGVPLQALHTDVCMCMCKQFFLLLQTFLFAFSHFSFFVFLFFFVSFVAVPVWMGEGFSQLTSDFVHKNHTQIHTHRGSHHCCF